MNRTDLTTGLASPQLTDLALIWPYDPRGGVIAGILPLSAAARHSVVAGGYHVVAAVRQQAPYTHVVAAGGQSYLATLVPTVDSPPRVAIHGPSAAWQAFRALAAAPALDVGVTPRTVSSVREDADHQEQAWESEGGALADNAHARVAVDPSPCSVPVQDVDAGVLVGGDRPMTGTITDLRPGGFGFIASNAYGTPWRLSFRRGAVDDGFVELHLGQRVRFDQEAIPGGRGQHAVGVVPLD